MNKGLLALEDGTVYEGCSFGALNKVVTGEVCFNTSMSGYQEILTDPSYKGQIVTMTYPEIGNYGVNAEDVESYQPHVQGFVVRSLSPVASNWRHRDTLEDYLEAYDIPAIQGIDTRALTKKLRVQGALKAVLSTDPKLSPQDAVQMAQQWHGLVGVDYVKEVSCKKPFEWDEHQEDSLPWEDRYTLNQGAPRTLPPTKYRIAAIDYGIKYNILRRLRQHGFSIKVFPATVTAEEILKENFDGVFLSNGPGDPAALPYAHKTVKGLLGKMPIFGICLGHQILGHAFGGKTFKLKFGHRGANQPVKDFPSGKVIITCQNHGFAVDMDSVPKDEVELTQVNLNDRTCEGMRHKKYPVFSVQYHPEASPGPHDATFFFKEFAHLIEEHKRKPIAVA